MSLIKTSAVKISKKNSYKELGHQGFSIIEVMVALMLVVLVFGIMPIGVGEGDREKLEEVIFDLDRATRFAVNESILRNAVTRIVIDFQAEPMEYAVEYGLSSNIILPEVEDESKMSLKDRENQQKTIKSLDAQFNKVAEFSEENKKLPDGIEFIGVASSYLNSIKQDGKASIYFYPTGEKDNALIFISSEEEMATLDIPPFEDKTTSEFYLYSDSDLANLSDSQDNKMKEIFSEWLKE